jgi:hypothetical protein
VGATSEIISACYGNVDRNDENANRGRRSSVNRRGSSSKKQPQTVATGELHRNRPSDPESLVPPVDPFRQKGKIVTIEAIQSNFG